MKKIVLVDDHPIFRDGIKQTLAATGKFSVVHEANSVASLAGYLRENRGQLSEIYFVIDISLPDGSGFELLPMIAAAGGFTQHCTMLSMHDGYEYAEHAFAENAYGYVIKSDDQQCILACLESLEQGEPYLSPGVRSQDKGSPLKEKTDTQKDNTLAAFSSLSKRESAILKLVAEGKTSKEISKKLFLSQRTVENHRAKMTRKLGVSGPNGLIALAIKYKDIINLADVTAHPTSKWIA